MSRYSVDLEESKKFVYGWDHALGYFYELWDDSLSEEVSECLIKERSSFLDKMQSSEMVEAMIDNRANQDHIEMVLMDLPF